MALTNNKTNTSFDLRTSRGQRSASFRFKLINGVTNQPLRDLTPLRDSVPTLSHDASRTIPRTLDIALGPDDTANINTLNNRVLLYMIIDGVEWPLGRYMFVNNPRQKYSFGTTSSVSLTDEMFIVDQTIETGFSALLATSLSINGFGDMVTPLEQIDQTARRLLAPLNITFSIENTPYSSIGAWPVGTSRARILGDMATDGDYFSPWINHYGVLKMIRTFDPNRVVPDFNFDDGNRIVYGSITESDNLLQAANRIIVVSNGTSSDVNAKAPIVGIYDVPPSAPHSFINRGFIIADVQTRQIESTQQAISVARTIGLSQTAFEFTELVTPPDPRHDSYDVIRWDNKLWLERSWSMELIEGGTMQHSLQRMYTS